RRSLAERGADRNKDRCDHHRSHWEHRRLHLVATLRIGAAGGQAPNGCPLNEVFAVSLGRITSRLYVRRYLRTSYSVLTIPPSTSRFWPVMKLASSLSRNKTTLASSCRRPMRPMGMVLMMASPAG